jgi:hypothetical protein
VRLGDVTAGALVIGVCRFRDVLRKAFIEPTGNAAGVQPMHDEMNNFVPEKIAGKFGRIALDEETALRMDSARPRFQFAERLKLLPFFRPFENVDVRLRIAGGLFALELFGHDAIVKFRFHRYRGGDVTVNKMVNEMFGLGVLPLVGMNGERFFAQWVRIALAKLRKFYFGRAPKVAPICESCADTGKIDIVITPTTTATRINTRMARNRANLVRTSRGESILGRARADR